MLLANRTRNKTLKREVSTKDLQEFQKNAPDHWTWKRAEIIRLASSGYNNLEIQEITGINEKNIRDWINRFNAKGFPGLLRRKTTKHTGKLTAEEIEYLKEILRNPPSLFGYHVFAWTAKLVWHLIQDIFGIKYHRRYIYSLLGKIGFKMAKPYPIHIKQNEKEVEKFYSQVLSALQKKKKFEGRGLKVIVLAQDESHVRVEYPNIRVICPKDEKPRIKTNWDKNLKISIHGCIDNEGKWTFTQEDTANRESFCRHLYEIVENYPDYQVFMILIDNFTYHDGDI